MGVSLYIVMYSLQNSFQEPKKVDFVSDID